MKFFNSIQPGKSGAVCKNCVNFQNDPALMEESFPGLRVMSSGYASIRDQDGLCNFHQIYLSARDSCPQFMPCATELKKLPGKV